MTLTVKKLDNGLYEAQTTPPHTREPWKTAAPMAAGQLVDELLARGAHQQDIGDAMDERDSLWIEHLTP